MDIKGKIMTVMGPIDPGALGITMTHEHLHIDAPSFFSQPAQKFQCLVDAPFEMENLGWIRQNPYSHKPNLSMTGEDSAIRKEMITYKENGGNSIVENTTIGIDRNLPFLKAISETTGVKIVAGTGFYCENYQKQEVKSYSEEKMAEIIRSELIDGVEGVRCGIIGEIGCTWPLSEFEKRSLRSAAMVQEELGYPVAIHPGRSSKAPAEIMRIFCEAGGKAQRTVMAHLDRTFLDNSSLLEFAETGTYLEYDLFGIEVSYYQLLQAVDMPSDCQRIRFIKTLIENGLEDRILIAQDIHTRHRLTKYGGHGYSHILVNVIPMMRKRGISQEQIDKLLKCNPSEMLTIV